MSSEPWTIERIAEALGDPDLVQDFMGEINRAPAHDILRVFAYWERTARDVTRAAERIRELAAYDERGETPPGEWVDGSGRVAEAIERIESHRAA